MMLPLLMLLQAAGPPAPAANPLEKRFDACVDTATDDPVKGEQTARAWALDGGGFLAQQCLGMAHAAAEAWVPAADAFTAAAHTAENAKDARAANYWAQAGNAWLAAGDADKARGALDAALATPALTGLKRGEAELDRARALVLLGDKPAARTSLDRALALAGDDPLAWLLSATLARQMVDLPRAKTDIAAALSRASDDASVQLEAGNIAALAGDEAGAKLAWTAAARIGGEGPVGVSAKAALAQFD